jgi:hypothetical protein
MKIKVRIQRTEEVDVDVEFPLYLKGGDVFDSGGFYDAWYRFDADGRMITVSSHHDVGDKVRFECEIRGLDLRSLGGYLRDPIGYKRIDAAEFDDMLAQFKARLP